MNDENIILTFDNTPQITPKELQVLFSFDNHDSVTTKVPYQDAKEMLADIAKAWRAKDILVIPDKITAATTVIDMSKVGIVNIIPIV